MLLGRLYKSTKQYQKAIGVLSSFLDRKSSLDQIDED
jgi:hypothetical protein